MMSGFCHQSPTQITMSARTMPNWRRSTSVAGPGRASSTAARGQLIRGSPATSVMTVNSSLVDSLGLNGSGLLRGVRGAGP